MMIIKIIKANSLAWYSNEIGKLCNVQVLDDFNYIVSGNDFNIIEKSDCEIIIDENTKWLLC